MCYFPVTGMACGHKEVSGIAIRCPLWGLSSIHPDDIAAYESQGYKVMCEPSRDLGSQGPDVCSGVMCGPCQVEIGTILDYHVYDGYSSETSCDERFMMSGGLGAHDIENFPENALDDLASDSDEALTSKNWVHMISPPQNPDTMDRDPNSAFNNFANCAEENSIDGTIIDANTRSDELVWEEPRRTYKGPVIEPSKGYTFDEESFPSPSKTCKLIETIESSNLKSSKRKRTHPTGEVWLVGHGKRLARTDESAI